MRRTHNVFPVAIKEFVGRPVQFETGMGADIAVQINFAALADGEDSSVFIIERKTFAAAVRDVVNRAQGLRAQITRPGVALRYAAQAAGVT